jgi:hypothetical protein
MATSDRNLPPQIRSREEEEEDLMNKILDRTQQVSPLTYIKI